MPPVPRQNLYEFAALFVWKYLRSPRTPTWLLKVPSTPPPRSHAKSFVPIGAVKSDRLFVARRHPPPPTTYGRTLEPCVPPIGIPTIRLPVTLASVTALLSAEAPTKFGDHEKSNSAPNTPAPMAASDTPYAAFLILPRSAPNSAPTNGVSVTSARAGVARESTSRAAADATASRDFMMMAPR